MTIEVRVTQVSDVRKHPDADRLTIVTVDGNEVVANLQDDGTPRWQAGEVCIYVPEGAIIPEDVLKERGYWDENKGKGYLGGSKGNRVKMQRFVGFESRGLLFKVKAVWDTAPDGSGAVLSHYTIDNGEKWLMFGESGENKTVDNETLVRFFGITEYVA